MTAVVGQAMLEPDAIKLLEQFGVPYPQHSLADSAVEAVQIADGLGYPVVMKVVSAQVLHKSDVGGVRIGLQGPDDVRQAYQSIRDEVASSVSGAETSRMLVCQQAEEGLELIVGALQDAMFGPTLMVGMGGVLTEVLDDVALRLVPIDEIDAREMIGELRGHQLLKGVRGGMPLDQAALVQLLLDVSRMMEANPDITELDLNPVRVYEKGILALDARVIRNDGQL